MEAELIEKGLWEQVSIELDVNGKTIQEIESERAMSHTKALFDCDYKLDCWPDCSQIVARLFTPTKHSQSHAPLLEIFTHRSTKHTATCQRRCTSNGLRPQTKDR
jgi:hypothetical protein